MRKTLVVIRREFVERVRSKWFIVSTVMGPLLMVAFVVVPILMARRGARERVVAVVDLTTGDFGQRLTAELERSQAIKAERVASEPARFGLAADSLSQLVGLRVLDGFLIVSDASVDEGKVEYRGSNVASPRDMQALESLVEDALFAERLGRSGVDANLVREARIRLDFKTAKISGSKTTGESAQGSFILAYAMWMLLYMGILLYGINVMGSVVEEKTSRIVEVLVSSLRPFELMSGKIIGVGGVGLFQFLIWGIAATLLIDRRVEVLRLAGVQLPPGAEISLPSIPIATMVVFLLFFLLGYFLYAAMFAAVGAMTGSEAEARQAANVVVMLLVVPSVLMIGILNDPGSSMAVALSLIPFCAPIAMPVRWAAGQVPLSEVALSVGILVATLFVITWIAGRIYRVGILMYGKRPGLKELVRWVRVAA
jgi:ABC-2 type transport system permease protein